MLVGYMRVSSETDRQNTDLQKDALIKCDIDERNIYEDNMSGIRDDRPGLKAAFVTGQAYWPNKIESGQLY
jgi:DNA invertase Pin-like site-specific DNA recombinase